MQFLCTLPMRNWFSLRFLESSPSLFLFHYLSQLLSLSFPLSIPPFSSIPFTFISKREALWDSLGLKGRKWYYFFNFFGVLSESIITSCLDMQGRTKLLCLALSVRIVSICICVQPNSNLSNKYVSNHIPVEFNITEKVIKVYKNKIQSKQVRPTHIQVVNKTHNISL